MQNQEEWDQLPTSHPYQQQHLSAEANHYSWLKHLMGMLKRYWKPEPVQFPMVDKDLPHLSSIERAAEVMRFMFIKLEYWLSPKGALRQFIKLNLRLAVILAIPFLLVAPLVTMALGQFKLWIVLLTQTFSNFILFPLSVILSILLVCGTFYIGRSLVDMRLKYRRDDRRDNYY